GAAIGCNQVQQPDPRRGTPGGHMSGDLSVSSSIPADISHTTVEEARQGLGAEGQPAPEGTVPVMIEDGDYISLVMQRMGLDWTDEADRVQFLMDNPQFITADALAEHPE